MFAAQSGIKGVHGARKETLWQHDFWAKLKNDLSKANGEPWDVKKVSSLKIYTVDWVVNLPNAISI